MTEQQAEQPVRVREVTPEAEPEQPSTEVQRLADLVKGCWGNDEDSKECKVLGAEFEKAAKQLNIPVGELIDSVFELAKKANTAS